jgi:zinc finger protein
MSDNANLFPSLGEIATRTDARADALEGQVADGEQEDEDRDMQEIESLCMRCHEQVSCCDHMKPLLALEADGQGITRLLLTSIPYFKEIVVSSFLCTSCGWRDTEIQSAGEIQRASFTNCCFSRG